MNAVDKLIKSQKVIEFIKNNPGYTITNAIQLARDAGGDALVKEISSAMHLARGFAEAYYEVILYKGHQIYPTLTKEDAL